jgi:hypothetical protein
MPSKVNNVHHSQLPHSTAYHGSVATNSSYGMHSGGAASGGVEVIIPSNNNHPMTPGAIRRQSKVPGHMPSGGMKKVGKVFGHPAL